MELRDSIPGRSPDRRFWSCLRYPECNGVHGAHPDGKPMGIPADKRTRMVRFEAHTVFDAAWRARGMSRSKAYQWLCEIMGSKDAHIGRMTYDECKYLVMAIEIAETLRQMVEEAV